MNEYLDNSKPDLNLSSKKDWWSLLQDKTKKNKAVIQVSSSNWFFLKRAFKYFLFCKGMAKDVTIPLNYYAAYAQVSLNNLN